MAKSKCVYPAWVVNLGLCVFLLGIVVDWFRRNSANLTLQLPFLPVVCTSMVLAVVALHRRPARSSDQRWWVYLVCLASVLYVYCYDLAGAQESLVLAVFWGRVAMQLLANLTLLSLGRSYAMLPALREVRTGFIYGFVRHPVYGLYMLADLCIVALCPSLWNAGAAGVGAIAFLLRSRLEENVLSDDPAYQKYMRVVRWRFVPGVY